MGEIIIEPFEEKLLNPNSYNFKLCNELLVYDYEQYIDPTKKTKVEKITIPHDGIVLYPHKLYLGCTYEKMGSKFYVPFISGRSSIGRLGLFVHITAPLGDIGFVGQWTLQLHATVPIKVYPFMKIGQIYFIVPKGEITLYRGKYQGSRGPKFSEIYKDFEDAQ